MQLIPVEPVANQVLTVNLGGQRVRLRLYQKRPGMFCDIFVNDALVLGGVPCRDRVKMVRDAYLGFPGDLSFFDLIGAVDPIYQGLGSRFVLAYLPPSP